MRPAFLLIPLLITAFALGETALVVMALHSGGSRDGWVHVSMLGAVFAEVSLAVLWGAMVRLSVGWRVALAAAVPALGGLAISQISSDLAARSQSTLFLVIQAALLSLIVAVASAAGCVFGRVDQDSAAASAGRARWQTSIGSLLLLTTTTAASLSLLKWLFRIDHLAEMGRDWILVSIIGVSNVALTAAISVAVLTTGRRLLRTAFLLVGTAAAAAAYWCADTMSSLVMLSIVIAQTAVLLAGLAVFRACGWRIARRPKRTDPPAD